MGAGAIGGEVAFGYNPSFFGTQNDFGNNTELDLMARIAGFRLRDRWAGWDRAPFTADSGSQVAVYQRL